MSRKPTKTEMLEMAATIYGEMIAGSTDDEIMDVLGIDAETFSLAKKFMLESRAEVLRSQPREHVYIEYVTRQEHNIQDLNKFISGLDSKKQYNALVGAIRLRADIIDRIVTKGQEFGLIRKEPERREVVAGVLVAELSTPDLRKAIAGQVSKLNELVERYGDTDIMSLPPPMTHHGKGIETTGEALKRPEGKVKAKTSRRSGGRRRVRDA